MRNSNLSPRLLALLALATTPWLLGVTDRGPVRWKSDDPRVEVQVTPDRPRLEVQVKTLDPAQSEARSVTITLFNRDGENYVMELEAFDPTHYPGMFKGAFTSTQGPGRESLVGVELKFHFGNPKTPVGVVPVNNLRRE